MMKRFNKKENLGITLVALVVTIIIILILAGVTIGLAMNGTGLFDKAKLATDKYNNSVEEENNELEKASNEIAQINSNRDTVTISSEEYTRLLNSSNANNYSADEKVVGTWTNSKPIYQKVFTVSASLKANALNVIINSTTLSSLKIEKIIDAKLLCGNSYICGIDYVLYDGSLKARSPQVSIGVSEVILQYTKTDTN